MGRLAGTALKLSQTALYIIEFCCAAIILGIYSYFLAVESNKHLNIPIWERAVEGLSGAGCLYLIFAIILTVFLGGVAFFAFLGVVLDILFCGAFIAIAIMTRNGAYSCRGVVNTPLGTAANNVDAPGTGDYGYVCRLNKVCFAVSIIALVLFLISAFLQVSIARNHKKEKRFGPGPNNDYTSGSGRRRFWQRKPKDHTQEAELGTVAAGGLAVEKRDNHLRPSHETGYTGSTVAAPAADAYGARKYETGAQPIIPTATGSHAYYTEPTGTAVNPYGYDNTTRGKASNF